MLHPIVTVDKEMPVIASRQQSICAGPPARVAISSIFGAPSDPRTWSGAPSRIVQGFEALGMEVVDVFPHVTRAEKYLFAAKYMLSGYGRVPTTLSLSRDPMLRSLRTRRVKATMAKQHVDVVLHTGTLDLPANDCTDTDHYLYCDHTWDLWLRHEGVNDPHTLKARVEFDFQDRLCYAQMKHIFTFGEYVRDNLINHYDVSPHRVTSVGSGMGHIEPYFGSRAYGNGLLLFVAKHYFELKGGHLVLEAFRIARRFRNDLRLAIVWDGADPDLPERYPEVEFYSGMSWDGLTDLYRQASLFVEPMFNDPWGQVYLEALVSRTPVLGLNRNGLPEITEQGRHGFLVEEASPEAIAEEILRAMSAPDRLACMGLSGQSHVLKNYSWDRVVTEMAAVMSRRQPDASEISYRQ